jgi:hypothetical protein
LDCGEFDNLLTLADYDRAICFLDEAFVRELSPMVWVVVRARFWLARTPSRIAGLALLEAVLGRRASISYTGMFGVRLAVSDTLFFA